MQEDIRNCGQLVCVGEWWAASLFLVRVLDDDTFFLNRGQSGVISAISKEVPMFLVPSTLESRSSFARST